MNPPEIPPAVAALFPETGERRLIETWLTEQLGALLPGIESGSVTPDIDMDAFRRELAEFDFAASRPLRDVIGWTQGALAHGIVQMGNPRYFGLFNPGPSFPSQCADRLSSLFNPQLASSASSPVPVHIERHVIEAWARRAGLGPRGTGHFATGGSEANYTALICALTAAHPGFATDGARALPGPARFYTSQECHIAWLKIAHQAGIGRSALRMIGSDGAGRMDPSALRGAIDEDRSRGGVPVMVVATAGTTGGGMVDPLHACGQIAGSENLWYHVDAAWGGAALASEKLRPLLDGISQADSITIDAHKWLATTMGCAMYLTRRPELLSQAFHASAGFMPSSLTGMDPYLNTVQWSRRFIGLRLFLTMAVCGWEQLGSHVERSIAVTETIKSRLLARGWSALNDSKLAVLNVVPPPGLDAPRTIVRRVVASGRAWVASAVFEGRDVVRICATHGQSDEHDIEELIAVLNGAA